MPEHSIDLSFPNDETYSFKCGEPVVILGANGSGKTRFGVKIEALNDAMFLGDVLKSEKLLVHRISAQKSLQIDDSISILDNESSQRDLFYGSSYIGTLKINGRFNDAPATSLLNDYSRVLALLFSEDNKLLQNAHAADREAESKGLPRPPTITTLVEKATRIWNELLPHRKIDLSGNGVHVISNNQRYHGKEMSDGERVMLYMICQVLVVKEKSVLIIDEPELHIHKALVDRLWTLLENERQDCVFMYITHDLDFAMSRNTNRFLWMKSYDGEKWEYEFLEKEEFNLLPSTLLCEIIGSRKKILFVEGERGSYDTALYKEIYADFTVIPCGSCQDVIRYVKSKNGYGKLNSIQVAGIVDRDYRTDREIKALQQDDIYFVNVAEVENLFIVPELLFLMEKILLANEGSAEKALDEILRLYGEQKEKQVGAAVAREVKFQLSEFEMDKDVKPADKILEIINNKYSQEVLEQIIQSEREKFNQAKSVENVLAVFNFKGLTGGIGRFYGLNQTGEYARRVLKALRTEKKAEILDALKKYLPEIPVNTK